MDPEVAGSKPVIHPSSSSHNVLISWAVGCMMASSPGDWLRRGFRIGLNHRLVHRGVESIYGLPFPAKNEMSLSEGKGHLLHPHYPLGQFHSPSAVSICGELRRRFNPSMEAQRRTLMMFFKSGSGL